MRAMAFAEHGGPEVLKLMDLPTPQIEDDEVLVRVKACALNHLDVWVRKGLGMKISMPHIGGCETTGEISEVGKSVKGFTAGQRVMISPGQADPSGEWCARGLDQCAPDYHIQGNQTQGGFAEFAKTKAYNLIPISDAWSFVEWAAVPLTFVTAWNMLHRRAGVQPNDNVVVWGASSGVGVAAIQIAKLAGARVLAVAGSDEKLRKAKDLGADITLNYNTQDVAKEVKAATGGQGADIVVEHVGAAVWQQATRCLGRNGRLVTCGATTGPKVEIDLRFFFTQQHAVLGAYMGSRSDLLQCLKLVERRLLRPVVDSVFPLEKLREAQEKMERREMFGKIMVTP
ncbi:MAG TPA: zinc-binding dehydrogenase [Gemmataceae bacterium]|nr:zinc-binding dehydrogenase [Gemmataceae bacterium]